MGILDKHRKLKEESEALEAEALRLTKWSPKLSRNEIGLAKSWLDQPSGKPKK